MRKSFGNLTPEDTEVIDFFAPPRAEFLLGGKPTYMSEDSQTSNQSD
jgi:hypothetical protein